MKTEPEEQEVYNELAFYTLSHPDPAFIHQNVVDAFAAQTATKSDKPIKITFALVGLYLCLEKGYTGRQAQLAHVKLAKHGREWPRFTPLEIRGEIRVADVLAAAPGAERDAQIRKWCEAVWAAWKPAQQQIRQLCKDELGVSDQ